MGLWHFEPTFCSTSHGNKSLYTGAGDGPEARNRHLSGYQNQWRACTLTIPSSAATGRDTNLIPITDLPVESSVERISPMVSPQKAADRAGVSRRTVMIAIESLKLKAVRDNRNRWQVDPDDLSRWIRDRDTRPDTSSDTSTADSTDTYQSGFSSEEVELRIANARLEVQLEAANGRIADLEKRVESRDADYQRVLSLLDEAQKPKGFFSWLIGRIEK